MWRPGFRSSLIWNFIIIYLNLFVHHLQTQSHIFSQFPILKSSPVLLRSYTAYFVSRLLWDLLKELVFLLSSPLLFWEFIFHRACHPGGPVVIILASGSEVCGFAPGRGRWIFSERKNPEYDFLRKGSNAVGPVSKIYAR